MGEHGSEFLAGVEAELVPEDFAEAGVLAEGFGGVAFGQVDGDDDALGAFAEWVEGDRGQRGDQGRGHPAGVEVVAGEGFQGVQAELAE